MAERKTSLLPTRGHTLTAHLARMGEVVRKGRQSGPRGGLMSLPGCERPGSWGEAERGTTLPGDRRAPDDSPGGPGPARRPLRGRGGRATAADALELITSLGEFDVAIVELSAGANGDQQRPHRDHGDPRPAQGASRARDRRPRLAARSTRPRRGASSAGATAYVAKSSPCESLAEAVDAAADSESYVDPAAREAQRRQRRAHPPPARDPAALRRRALDRGRRQATRTAAPRRSAPTPRPSSPGSSARDRAHAVAIGLRNSLIE